MKKFLVSAVVISMFAAACGGGGSSTGKDSTAAVAAAPAVDAGDITQNPDYIKGLELIGGSDCLTCHQTNAKLVGPSYEDVANKYAGMDTAVTHLAKKVIAGGGGVWGDVAMTPHPQLTQADAEQMVKYVLLLKTK